MTWNFLTHSKNLNLACLLSGQSFSWRVKDDIYTNVLDAYVISLRLFDSEIQFKVHHPPTYCTQTITSILNNYFSLDVNLSPLYTRWSKDPHFSGPTGIRLLRQPIVENTLGFITSANNNIQRITALVQKLASCGDFLAEVDGQKYYSFPTPYQLSHLSEDDFKKFGFGYRAKYIYKTVALLTPSFIKPLASLSLSEAKEQLLTLPGVGPKVSDCILLMSLGFQVVPVDTHILRLAQRDYGYKTKGKLDHELVQKVFERAWGEMKGWAHLVLFAREVTKVEVKEETSIELRSTVKREGKAGKGTKSKKVKVKQENTVKVEVQFE